MLRAGTKKTLASLPSLCGSRMAYSMTTMTITPISQSAISRLADFHMTFTNNEITTTGKQQQQQQQQQNHQIETKRFHSTSSTQNFNKKGQKKYQLQRQNQNQNQNNRKSENNATTTTRGQKQRPTSQKVDLEDVGETINNILSRLASIQTTAMPQQQQQQHFLSFSKKDINIQEETSSTIMEILDDTREFFSFLTNCVDQKQLNPAGKHGKELSRLLELVLFVYSQAQHLTGGTLSLYADCQQVLDTLKKWNLSIRSRHCEYSIVAACEESRWKDASDMFWTQINPEAGYNPTEVSVVNPYGLYAIAKWAQDQDAAVVENVFDAVLQLSMVSPNDQRTYVLAAGTALGQAGEWESAVQYLETSPNASDFGESLLASVMHACLLCDQPSVALKIFEAKNSDPTKDIGREWQWGGESDLVDPLCRDLALRSMGSQQGKSASALAYLNDIISEDSPISIDALLGIALACEQDSNLDGALRVLFTIFDNATSPRRRIVTGNEMFEEKIAETVSVRESKNRAMDESWLPYIGDILASTMRTCNSSSHFGTALFCLKLASAYSESTIKPVSPTQSHAEAENNMQTSIFQLCEKTNTNLEGLVVPTMIALCGLRCSDQAIDLFEQSSSYYGLEDDDTNNNTMTARLIYESAVSDHNAAPNDAIRIGNPWASASKLMDVLVSAARAIELSNRTLKPEEKFTILNVLAATMNASTNAHQPDLSLLILSWMDNILGSKPDSKSKKLMSDLIRDDRQRQQQRPRKPTASSLLMMDDAILAESITALRWNKNTSEAVELFEDLIESKPNELEDWRLSCTAGFSALIADGRGDDAWKIFKAMDPAAMTTEGYAVVGHFLARTQNWNDLSELYRTAIEQGYLSEDLGLLAMKAIVFSKVDNRLRVLRSIVNDNASIVGLDAIGWTNSRYWHVKRAIGFNYARLLMWWNDPETCHIDELNFAIQNFKQQRDTDLKPKNDVIRAIVNTAGSFDYSILNNGNRDWRHLPHSPEEWVSLLKDILEEVRTSSLRFDSSFVEDVVKACLHLGCTELCTEFVEYLLDTDCRVNKKTLERALEAARLTESNDLVNDITMVLSDGSPNQ